MVVGYNEATLLDACLKSIKFCDEIFYTDLGSSDNSTSIALRYGATILKRNRNDVPSCEMVQADVVHQLKNEWVLFIDPDEVVDKTLQQQILDTFEILNKQDDVGAIEVPWVFYFGKTRLKGTVWGGTNRKFLIVNKTRFSFYPIVHYGRTLNKSFKAQNITINEERSNVLHHYWMDSFKVFLAKHRRYIKTEPADRYVLGRRVSKKYYLFTPFTEFYICFIKYKGYKDGFLGLGLSVFYAWYMTKITNSILKIQINENRKA